MKQETKRRVKKDIANTFGSLGYSIGFLQWLWAIVLYLSVIQSTTSFVFPANSAPAQRSSDPLFTLPEPLGTIIIAVVVILMVAITVYALVAIPRSIVKTGNKIVHKTAETMAPVLIKAQHKHDTKRIRIKLTARLALLVKLLLILIPFILTAASKFLEKQSIDYSIAMIVACGLACCSILLFAIQYLLAGILKVKMSDLW